MEIIISLVVILLAVGIGAAATYFLDKKLGLIGLSFFITLIVISQALYAITDGIILFTIFTGAGILFNFSINTTIDYTNLKYGRDEAKKILNVSLLANLGWIVIATLLLPIIVGQMNPNIPMMAPFISGAGVLLSVYSVIVMKITQTVDIHLFSKVIEKYSKRYQLSIGSSLVSTLTMILDKVLFFGGLNIIYQLMVLVGFEFIKFYEFIPFAFNVGTATVGIGVSLFGIVTSSVIVPYLVKKQADK